jgi:hypothetical protein
MSLADDAKLLLIPTAYNTSKVYSVFPTDGDGDFTYTRSGDASRVNPGGLIETVGTNIPRIDHTGGGCPTLLLEPQRTNLQAYSENFSGAAWTASLVTITANSSISPNGELTAYKLETDETNFTAELSGFLSITSNTEYTYSIYVKADTTSICRIELTDNLNSSDYYYGRVTFDMSTETLTTSLATASFDKLDGGWYRLKMTATSPNPIQGSTRAKIILPEVGSIFIWGAQTEAGGYATSYIENPSNVSGETRLKDECINGGDADLFDITEGTFFVDAVNFSPPLNGYNMITLSNGSSNLVRFLYESSRIRVSVIASNNVEQDYFIAGVTSNQRNKVALTFKKDEFKVYHNGVLKDTDTSGDIPTGLDKLNFSMTNNLSRWFEGKVHDTRVYDKVLTEAEAIKLTTL